MRKQTGDTNVKTAKFEIVNTNDINSRSPQS
jgi:hypothetical protein